MRKLIISFMIIVIATIIAAVTFLGRDLADRKIADSIERYPNSSSWNVKDSSGWPDGSPSAEIFFSTKDSPETVIAFYKEKLSSQGWEFKEEGTDGPKKEDKNDIYLFLQKNSTSFSISSKFYTTDRDLKFAYNTNFHIRISGTPK